MSCDRRSAHGGWFGRCARQRRTRRRPQQGVSQEAVDRIGGLVGELPVEDLRALLPELVAALVQVIEQSLGQVGHLAADGLPDEVDRGCHRRGHIQEQVVAAGENLAGHEFLAECSQQFVEFLLPGDLGQQQAVILGTSQQLFAFFWCWLAEQGGLSRLGGQDPGVCDQLIEDRCSQLAGQFGLILQPGGAGPDPAWSGRTSRWRRRLLC